MRRHARARCARGRGGAGVAVPGLLGLRVAALPAALALLVPVVAGCASTPANRSQDQVEAGVRAAERDLWEEAEFRWLKAIAIDSDNGRALNNLAVRHEHLGEPDQALERYRQALEVATPAELRHVQDNLDKLQRLRRDAETGDDGEEGSPGAAAAREPGGEEADDSVDHRSGGAATPGVSQAAAQGAGAGDAPVEPVRTVEITVSVAPPEGPNLSQYRRILVGNFVVREAPSGVDLNEVAVRFFRRRLVQRTFFQTIDRVAVPLPEDEDVLERADLWTRWAESVGADLVFTGELSVVTEDRSGVVRERIRSPVTGEMQEVARFRQVTVYRVDLDYVLLRGEDAEVLLDGSLQAEREFSADEGLAQNEAITEVLEELLPEVLEVITPAREEQLRVLIY